MRPPASATPPALALLCALLLGSCGGSEPAGPETPPAPIAGSLTLVGGDAQSGTVGAALGSTLVVSVKSTTGASMAGQAVTWSVASGGGSVSQASTTSGADGNASVTWTLGGTVGSQTVTATAAALSVTFTATATAGAGAQVVVTPTTGTLEALEATVQLQAEVRDQFGNPTQGAVQWSSSDASIVTVDSAGVAKAVARGTAEVVATSASVTGKATLTVAQTVSSVVVAPDAPSVVKDGTVQLTAEAKDANGFPVGDAAFTWSTSDASVASVDTAGLVTGVSEGTASVAATSGGRADTVTVTVTPAAFKPTGDTEISGTVNVAEVDIPAGVTVTLRDDAVINATGNVTIAGAVRGDCVGASVNAGGDLTLTGTLSVACSDSTRTASGVALRAAGALTLDGVTVEASGEVTVSNVPPPSGVGIRRAPSTADGEAQPCRMQNVTIRLGVEGFGSQGAPGSPRGGDGGPGKPVEIRCAGNLIVEGGRFTPGWGGGGGHGSSTTTEPAAGGNGGAGGDVIIQAGGNIIFGKSSTVGRGDPVRMDFGSPGGGGGAWAQSKTPTAVGGDAGRFGLPFVEAGGAILIREEGAVRISWFSAFHEAGDADAIGQNGEDATASQAAEVPGTVTATGGRGPTLGLSDQTIDLVGGLFKGEVINPLFLDVEPSPFLGRSGGRAGGLAGNGGDGSEEFPGGAKGGSALLRGGQGGSVTLWDNRWNRFVTAPGEGGEILFGLFASEVGIDGSNVFTPEGFSQDRRHAHGGRGWADCRVGNIRDGGRGGEGGAASGIVGQSGTSGSTPGVNVGEVRYRNWGSGGDAGNGPNEPRGGAAGDASGVLGQASETTNSFHTGTDGNPCAYLLDPAVSVASDANGHAPFIGLAPSQLTVTLGEGNTITVSGNGNFVTVTGTVDASGTFTATGSGTVAGFPNVPVSFEGTLSLDLDGRATGIQAGTLTMDATNSNLPGNSAGVRNPAVYSVTGSRIG